MIQTWLVVLPPRVTKPTMRLKSIIAVSDGVSSSATTIGLRPQVGERIGRLGTAQRLTDARADVPHVGRPLAQVFVLELLHHAADLRTGTLDRPLGGHTLLDLRLDAFAQHRVFGDGQVSGKHVAPAINSPSCSAARAERRSKRVRSERASVALSATCGSPSGSGWRTT